MFLLSVVHGGWEVASLIGGVLVRWGDSITSGLCLLCIDIGWRSWGVLAKSLVRDCVLFGGTRRLLVGWWS